jgi:hypothetical protein
MHQWTEEQDQILKREWPLLYRRIPGKTTESLARKLNVSVPVVQLRAGVLGLKRLRIKEPEWTKEEMEILDKTHHMTLQQIKRRLARRGYHRTEAAIGVKRSRNQLSVINSSNAYSASGLAQLMGVSQIVVIRWIRLGLIDATPSGATVDERSGGPGDRWLISPKAVRHFIITHTAQVDLTGADRFWLVDLLAGGDYGNSLLPTIRETTCGRGDGSGFDEMRVMG